jgi:chromosome segregation ATPase
MKLHSETLQNRIDELERENSDMVKRINRLQEQIQKNRAKDIDSDNVGYLRKQIDDLNALVKTYEEHNLKIPQLEKKLRSQKASYESEIKTLELNYKEKLAYLTKKLDSFEEKYNTRAKPVNQDDFDQVNVI